MSGGRGAGDRPLTYAGEYDATRTYLARQVVTHSGAVFMALALTTGHAPPNPTYWLTFTGSTSLTFFRDRYALASSGAQTVLLSYTPTDYSAHVFLNGVVLDESVDYTISAFTVSLLTAAGAVAGDILDVRYAVSGAGGAALTGYPAAVLVDGPAMYWRYGDTSGTTATDSSGNGRHGAYGSHSATLPTLGVPGLLVGDPDTCVTFDGANQYAVIGYGAWMETAHVTVEAVVKTTGTGIQNIIDRDGSPRAFQFRKNASQKLEFVLIGTSTVTCTGATSINDGQPHHVAATCDGSVINVYVDGVLDGSSTTAVALPLATGTGIISAQTGTAAAQFWDGELDELAYYTTALSAGRIAAHFAASGL